ncbi:MAG TPA: nicotinate-nucleotide diphosphorylase (carboxylating), partial [bacterium]|nr:nicotinate-nucleotide diphosphorylase (carboxylating) [bacterium]
MNKSSRIPFMLSDKTRLLLKAALEEDIGREDRATALLIPKKAKGRAVISAREPGILCGEPVALELFRILDPSVKLKFACREGDRFQKNKPLIQLEGNVASILKAERTLLNFLGHLSGIAMKTREFVQRVKKYPVFILDTRKTTPLWREIE